MREDIAEDDLPRHDADDGTCLYGFIGEHSESLLRAVVAYGEGYVASL